jgi:wobble nucleotide-excising tRNase
MIESIEIKNVASYDSKGVSIENLRKVNFIYGANGSGKTTISNFLNDQEDARFPECKIKWLSGDKLDTLIYNKEFRERNFGKGVVDGVFTLGEATKEQIEEIEKIKKDNDSLKTEILKKRDAIIKLEKQILGENEDFKEHLWRNSFKKHENEFREAFRGIALQKEPFMNECLKQFKENKSELLSKEYLVKKANTLLGKIPPQLNRISNLSVDEYLLLENHSIWKKRIIGKSDINLSKLIQRLNISDWVGQGKNYLEEDSKTCPFCQKQTIDDDFKVQLESFFDKEYVDDLDVLKKVNFELKQSISIIIQSLKDIEKTENEVADSKLNLNRYRPLLKSIELQFAGINELIESKLKEPSRSIEILSLSDLLKDILNLIEDTNKQIDENNKIVINYQEERKKLIGEIWRFIIEEEETNLKAFSKKSAGLKKVLVDSKNDLKEKGIAWKILDSKIKELNKNVTSVQPTIDEINRLLKFYGFLNFEIVPLESDSNLYQILREDGNLAEHTLSEGEITFITFLYFMQLVKGGLSKESVNNDRIVVIDDPISSLDSSVIFVISSLIKELIKKVKTEVGKIKQVILLTHNVYFHKEVSFEGARPKGQKPAFWILRKKDRVSNIQYYDEHNPIHSSYELLSSELRNWKGSSGITIQNTMRRILENYFSILGNKRDDYIIGSFSTYEEQEICRSLLSWVNEGSHTLPDDLVIEIPDDTIEIYLSVFKGIFNGTKNIGHYMMMMKDEGY